MKNNKKIILSLILLFATFTFVACSNSTKETTEQAIGMPNPFVEYEKKSDAVAAVGFDLKAPSIIQGYDKPIYSVNKGIDLFEIIFYSSDNEIRYRKAKGNDDISGDYNKYDEDTTKEIAGINVRLRGNEFGVNLATWTYGDYTYSYSIKKEQAEENVAWAVESLMESEKETAN